MTKISYWENMTFFDSNNEFFFSYSKEHLTNSYSVSPILTFLNYKQEENKLPEVFYSEDYRVILQTIYFDLFQAVPSQPPVIVSGVKEIIDKYHNYKILENEINIYLLY